MLCPARQIESQAAMGMMGMGKKGKRVRKGLQLGCDTNKSVLKLAIDVYRNICVFGRHWRRHSTGKTFCYHSAQRLPVHKL
jgi:hypothetical protein